MTEHTVPDSHCPVCGYHADRASNCDGFDASPQPGDLSVCVACGAMLTFTPELALAELTDDQKAALLPVERELLLDAQLMVRAMKRERESTG